MNVKFSIALQGSYPIKDYISMAQLIERYEFEEIHVYDDLMFKPTWPILTLIGEHTTRVKVGPGIITPQIVHPCYHAAMLAELDELTGGRATCGIARGAFWELLGLEQKPPITMVREAIAIIRRLMSGSREAIDGKVFKAPEELFFRFEHKPRDVPIFIGTWGPKMCQLAGEVAVGVKSDGLWNPEYVPVIKENIEIGAKRVGRDPSEVEVIAGPLCSISANREAAMEAARRVMAVYLPYFPRMLECAGIPDEEVENVRAAAAVGDFEKGASYISPPSIRNFCVAGTPEDVIPQIEEMVEAGVTHVAFGHPAGPDFKEAVTLIGEKIIPHFT